MIEQLKKEANRTCTENGAAAHMTTGSDCLDLFATIGALRNADRQQILDRFLRAFTEDPDLAVRILFFARDVRGGLGERSVFRVCLQWLAQHEPACVRKNLPLVAEFGRWDDLLCLLDTPCQQDALRLIRRQFHADLAAMESGGQVSLLAKWLPSVNASSAKTVQQAKRIAGFLGMRDAEYRKTLALLRKHLGILENDLRQGAYTFDYAQQPSKAMFKYRKAFLRNDAARYRAFLAKVARGEARMHADTLMPYELVEPYLRFDWACRSYMRAIDEDQKAALNATWESLPAFAPKGNALAVIDTSASMYCQGKPMPASVALSLGLYFAQHNTGAFANHILEFSAKPRLIQVKGETFADRLRYVASRNEIANTNLEAVFDLILDTAVKNRVPAEEMPATLYLISDMEFDYCVRNADATVFENAKTRFASCGYQLPRIVFWNVQSRNTQQPVTSNEQGVALVSGCTPRIFRMVSDDQLSPLGYMLQILGKERYAGISA